MKLKVARLFHRKRSNRSRTVDFFIYFFLLIIASIMCFPLIYSISNSLKPIEELFIFPPRILVLHPTGDNFLDLFDIISDSWVPFSRYLFNTVLITIVGTFGQVIISSLAAYGMTKFRLPGIKFCFNLVVFSLMFTASVTSIPSYIIISKLGWIDTYFPMIVPFFQSSLGLYLLKQFMEASVPDSLIEAAKIDGATHIKIDSKIVMPLLKTGWMTLIILCVQSLWNSTGGSYIYSEELKPITIALSQLATGAISRAGVSAAITVIMMIVPVTVFLISQSQVLETMSTSGMKE